MKQENSRGSFLGLLVALLALFAFHSLLDSVLLEVVMSVVLLAAVWSVSRRTPTFIVGIILSLPAFVSKGLLHWGPSLTVASMGLGFSMVFIAFTAVTILLTVLRAQTVTTDTILGAICVYLLLAMLFALAYTLLEFLIPGSFVVDPGVEPLDIAITRALPGGLLYFSVTTLTTLGMGDVHPSTSLAQTIVSFEALAGQLYIAVLIARLVGLHTSRPSTKH